VTGTGNGLCDRCAQQRLVPNTRGSVFSLCRRSGDDPAYLRYPRVPVVSCAGFERREAGPAGRVDSGGPRSSQG